MTEIEVFFDGLCPICSKEIKWLKKLDKNQKILFTDISSNVFVPSDYGLTLDDFMAEIKGRLPDGTMISGVEVFRQLYSVVGFKSLVLASRLPVLSWILDVAYKAFAKNRLRWTGRCSVSNKCK